MRKFSKIIGIVALVFFVNFFFPVKILALCPDTTDPACPEYKGSAAGGGASGQAPSAWLKGFNPGVAIPTGDLTYITGDVAPFVISILIFLVVLMSLIFLLLGAVGMITSGGNKEGTAKAKGTITYAIVGLILGLVSFAIVKIIGQVVGGNF